MDRQQPVLCPSSRCKEGALVLGIVLENQTIAYADRRLKIDRPQAEQMMQSTVPPEQRFRFSSPCAQHGCGQWTGNKCGVIEEVLATPAPESLPRTLPDCAIRRQCRWYLQRAETACAVCRYVVTDVAVMTSAEAAELML